MAKYTNGEKTLMCTNPGCTVEFSENNAYRIGDVLACPKCAERGTKVMLEAIANGYGQEWINEQWFPKK